jgi:hypothetical protein
MAKTNKNKIDIKLIYGVCAAIIVVCIFVFWVIPMLTTVQSGTYGDVDCSGNWNDWSICDANTGKQTRTFDMKIPPMNGGRTCPLPQTLDCDVDCSGD